MPESTDPADPAVKARWALAAEAAKYVGCHYLRGACGARPGQRDGVGYRPGAVEMASPALDGPDAVTVCAAYSVITEKQVCSGRYAALPGGRSYDPDDWDIREYVAMARDLQAARRPQSTWPHKWAGFTPRKANWKAPGGIATKRVWGQPCQGVRHFDCIGLVAFVLEQVVTKQKAPQREITDYIAATQPRDKAKPWPGDIATIEKHHIGIIVDQNHVISATSGPYCVLNEAYNPAKWTRVGRFADAQLV